MLLGESQAKVISEVTVMWPWEWNLDWKQIIVSLITLVAGGLITAGGIRIRENRRKINFSATNVCFGPSLRWNLFMGRNYPSDDLVGLTCDLKFFSNKSLPTGLQNLRVEFCRTTYIGKVAEVSTSKIQRDLLSRDVPHSLQTLELPSRQFVAFELHADLERDCWDALRLCDIVRLVSETPEGKTMRFTIGQIQFPEMPAEGIRGTEYCSIQIWPNVPAHELPRTTLDGRIVIAAIKLQTKMRPPGQLMPPEEDVRYWTGNTWARSIKEARVYEEPHLAISDGESMKIWNRVPEEWLNIVGK